ncbi:serine palmitoyltransferase component [Cladochytrium tenue]|nr:serine palmitoyltransferase component [Cladochytrium tenue]
MEPVATSVAAAASTAPTPAFVQQLVLAVNASLAAADGLYRAVPGSAVLYRYVRDSYQNDPFRSFLEALLVAFMVWYVFMTSRRGSPSARANDVKLSEKEVQELCDEWEPEPLAPPLTEFQKAELEKQCVITSPVDVKVKLADGKERINLASYNFLGLLNRESIKEKGIEALRKYGVGTCGPRDVHLDLEAKIASFLGVDDCIVYAQGFSTISSVIPAFSKRGDILVVDEGADLAIMKGVQISRSVVKYFKHNDMDDLERVLNKIQEEAKKKKAPLTRRFIVVEGVYANHGDLCDLPRIVELKNRFKYRLIVDDSFGFGVLGATGRGIVEHFKLPPSSVEIYAASMANSLCAGGGFCAGTREIVEHQRLLGLAYTFSASLPAILTVSALEGMRIIDEEPAVLTRARENMQVVRSTLAKGLLPTGAVVLDGDEASPILHVRLRSRLSAGAAGGVAAGPLADREEEERVLQDVVDAAAKDGVLVTRARYVVAQELRPPLPSIRIVASAGLSKKDAERAAGVVRDAFKKTLKAHRLC